VRILYHHRTRAGDAQGIHIEEMIRAFRELGNEVEVVALSGEGDRRSHRGESSWPARILKSAPSWLYEVMSLGYNVYGYVMLRRRARAFRPDVLYERYSLNTFCGIWMGLRTGLPVILEVNAPLAQEQEQLGKLAFRRLARFSERWICANSTWTIVVSDVLKELLAAEGVPRKRMVVVTNGVDPRRFRPDVSDRAIRVKHGLDGKLVIGFVGWFRKWHGLELLLDIFHAANLADRRVHLLLVGDGPARADLERFVVTNALGRHVVFSGPVRHEEIPEYVAAMDVAVQPSAPEYACPMKIVEYMAMGRCVVAPDQPNIREVIDDGRNGLLFSPGDKKELKTVLLRAIGDDARRQALGKNALETVFSRGFLWSMNAQRAVSLARQAGPSR